jgi:myo-inositol 2-dehydrogenase/D-chiro-inositol 1-dehydrogenase
VELVGIVDADAESAGRLLADLYGGSGGGGAPPPAFGSISEAVRELQADHEEEIGRGFSGGLLGCVVCAPTSTHGQLIREAADRGLSVFVEKPVAERPLEVAELFDRCEAAGVRLCCGFQRRFDPSYVAAREVIRSGTIGTPLYAHLFFADHPLPSREYLRSSGGNIFVDLLAHDLDYILDALQDRIDTVYAVAASSDPDLRTAGVQDTATVLLTTRKGTIGFFRLFEPLTLVFLVPICIFSFLAGSLCPGKTTMFMRLDTRQALPSPCS